MGRRMGEKQSNQEDKELVLVAFEGEIASLETLVRLAREYGFRKVLSALVKDLQRAQAETIEIIAMAADDELRERLQVD
jgi:ferritin-like metal-binding protein YciE